MNEKLKAALDNSINIVDAVNKPPQPIDFVLPALARKTVGVLSAPGSTGKSMFALMAAMAVAGGKEVANALGIETSLSEPETALVLAAEDPEEILIHRIHAIGCRILGKDLSRLHVTPLAGVHVDIREDYDVIGAYAKQLNPSLIIVDTLSCVLAGAAENDNAVMSKVITSLTDLAKQTESAVLILHHVSKDATLNGRARTAQAARGASAIVDNARFGASMNGMTDSEAQTFIDEDESPEYTIADRNAANQYICYVVNKHNYSAPPPQIWYRRGAGGILIRARLARFSDSAKGKSRKVASKATAVPPTSRATTTETKNKPLRTNRRQNA
jgi:RecA-family ATPase